MRKNRIKKMNPEKDKIKIGCEMMISVGRAGTIKPEFICPSPMTCHCDFFDNDGGGGGQWCPDCSEQPGHDDGYSGLPPAECRNAAAQQNVLALAAYAASAMAGERVDLIPLRLSLAEYADSPNEHSGLRLRDACAATAEKLTQFLADPKK